MSIGLEILVILLLILLNGVFAMSELALVSVRQARLAVLEAQRVTGAATARRLTEDPQRFLPTVQVGITLISILAGVFGGARIAAQLSPLIARIPALAAGADELSLAVVVVMITYLTLVIGELVPKQLALRHPERIAAVVAPLIAFVARIAGPVVWLLGQSTWLVLRLLGAHRPVPQGVTEEELKAVLAEGAQTGVLEEEEHDMIARVLRLADKPVRAIMTPRTEVAWIDRADTQQEIAEALRTSRYSRLVVCDGSIDNPVGVVRASDLLQLVLEDKPLSLDAALRQPTIVPDTVGALDALERLKADEVGLALVMDEYGSFEGVVSAADVLEAIVGDPSNTAMLADDPLQQIESGMVADGLMPVDELKSRLDLPPLPAEGSYHTAGGLLLALLRRVPRQGDRIVFGGWRFEVLTMDGRRVEQVKISREPLTEG